MKWETRDGRRLAVQDMTDQHLANTLKYVRRKRTEAWSRVDEGYSFLSNLQGEMAIDACESAIAVAEERRAEISAWAEYWEGALGRELKRRSSA